jgi:hypothetical protein
MDNENQGTMTLNEIFRKFSEPVYTTPLSVLCEVLKPDEKAVIGNPPLNIEGNGKAIN